MNLLCQFKDIFGKPEKGFHARRLFGFALWDIIGTIILGFIFFRVTQLELIISILFIFIFGQFFHWLFCVDTAFIKLLQKKV
jgi:hypothetical protein